MKRRISTLFCLLSLTLIGIDQPVHKALADADAPVAVLTSCRGPVTVIRAGGKSTSATFGLSLNNGDEVKTGEGAEAEIMFSAGNWVAVGANSNMRIKGHPGGTTAAPKEAESFEVVSNFLKLKSSEGTGSISGLRSADKAAALLPIAPVQTKVRGNNPTFQWKIDDPTAELSLTVYNESGVQWQSDISNATALTYPADAPALQPGVSYSWTLETTDPLVSPPLRTTAAFFEIIAPADVASLDTELSAIDAKKPGPVTYHLMRASLFFDRGLMADAISETEAAVAADPDNGSLHAIMGRLYAEAGRTTEAMQEMQKSTQ
ncbi:MAG TPA: hypothetical protein VFX92_01360 [Candidatus Krumholzibacteria bacterium]|nr:hypothetical protein [Candidatus Krumholzibacteria bacterium]